MKDAGPRFPSFELVERQMQPARALRAAWLRESASTFARSIRPQRRGTRVFGASAAAIAVALALFWFGILASPQPTRAGMDPATIDPEALVANTLTNLPPFEEQYQRHIGILDKLEAR
jgi:hypothetical protein